MSRLTGKTSRAGQQQRHRLSNRDLLLRRVEELSQSQKLVDVPLCAEELRRKYRNDYGRMKQRLFYKLVDEAIQDFKHRQKVQALASPASRESLLQLKEEKHLLRFHDSNSSGDEDSSSDDSSDEEDSNSDVPHSSQKGEFSNDKRTSQLRISRAGSYSESTDEDEVLEPDCGFNLLNASICNTYKKNEATKEDTSPNDPSKSTPISTPVVQAKPVPAFAPPQAIAAAAARAAETMKAKKKIQASAGKIAKKTQETDDINSNGETDVTTCDKEKLVPRKRMKTDNQGKGEKGCDVTSSAAEAVSFSDLGGIDGIIGLLREIMFPLYNPGIYSWLGLQPIRGVLLHGPPGCGKTKLANAIAHEAGLPFLKISGPEVVSGMSGESEAKIRNLFSEATRLAPCIIFIDEIDSITSKRDNANREMERRIVTQLMTCMDDLNQSFQGENNVTGGMVPSTKNSNHVLIIGATNRPEAVDPALRRPGRFDHEILLGVPDENGRAQILSALSKNLRLEGSFDFKYIARCTPGFVGADLAALTREAGAIAIKRIVSSRDPNLSLVNISEFTATASSVNIRSERDMVPSLENESIDKDNWWKTPWSIEELHQLSITMKDFEEAVSKVQPSTKREGFSAIPNVKWEDVGALSSIQKLTEFFISRRIKHPQDYEVLGLDMDTGFLLYGPPGCGKTLLAKAVANDAQANFIYIKGPELLNKYVGESEQAVRALFSRARSCAPCILFFDEMDALAPRRGTDGNAVAERVLNQLLSEMDGAEKRKGVFMIGATNRPDMIDPAVLRPGRLGKLLYIPLPDCEGRLSILNTLTKNKPVSPDVDLASIAAMKQSEGLSGADLAALVNEACVVALQEKCMNDSSQKLERLVVNHRHFEIAMSQIRPSVSKQDLLYYEELPKKLGRSSSIMKGIPCEAAL